jgi:hypothetical protein
VAGIDHEHIPTLYVFHHFFTLIFHTHLKFAIVGDALSIYHTAIYIPSLFVYAANDNTQGILAFRADGICVKYI